jgi:K+/H+ antiporter YhaU regulatory subunit KhtT
VIAIRRDDNTIVNPGPEEIIHGDDVFVVVGRIEDAQRLRD